MILLNTSIDTKVQYTTLFYNNQYYLDDPSLALPPGMSLFDSHDLSSSFRNVYDQVFHNKKPATQREEVDINSISNIFTSQLGSANRLAQNRIGNSGN